MNRKGLLFHGIVLGILFSIGLFLVLTKSYTVQQEPAGTWHLAVIGQTLHLAEIDLLEQDQNARDTGWDIALLLAKQGGFSEDSGCGIAEGRNIWNNQDKWCLPVVKEVASQLVDVKIPQSQISFAEEIMLGYGERKIINMPGEKIQRYEYLTNVAIDLDYSFDEYAQLEQEARALVGRCGDSSELNKCISENKEEHWQLCREGIINEVGVFCVKSPGNYVIRGKPIVYELGLGFS